VNGTFSVDRVKISAKNTMMITTTLENTLIGIFNKRDNDVDAIQAIPVHKSVDVGVFFINLGIEGVEVHTDTFALNDSTSSLIGSSDQNITPLGSHFGIVLECEPPVESAGVIQSTIGFAGLGIFGVYSLIAVVSAIQLI
jgi:hypothetical protein